MAASSVTGTGVGSAEGHNKGTARMTLGSDHLIGPRVVMAGSVALTSGTPSQATVTFPQALSTVTGHYVMAVPVGATAAIAAAGVAVSSFTTSGFVLTGPNSVSTTMYWMVVKS